MKENVRVGFLLCSMSWNTNADGTGLKFDGDSGNYADMESIKNLTVHDLAELELFAQWKANTYNISYNANVPVDASSSLNGSMADSVHTYDAASELSSVAYSLAGYTWTGWNTAPDGLGTSYSDKEGILNLSAAQDETITLYAQWTPNQYTVSFDKGIGTITGDTSKTVIFDETYGTLPTLDNKTGYTALGW